MIMRAMSSARWQVAKRVGRHLPVVLMYHRVTDLDRDHYNLAVSPSRFEEQIAALCATRKVVPLDRLLDAPTGDERLAAITFDDGYRDVVTNALPVLERYSCPATLFITTAMLNSSREFWWDELVRILFETSLERDVDLDVMRSARKWRIGPQSSEAERSRILTELSGVLRYLPVQSRSAAIARMAALVGVDLKMRDSHAIVTADEVRSLGGTILSIGAHTQHHVSLPHCDPATQVREITASRDDCEKLTGLAPLTFAYPFGEYDSRVVERVRDAGFTVAVTAERRLLHPQTDLMTLPRIEVNNWSAAELLRRLP